MNNAEILIVDDDEMICKLLENIFLSWGMTAKICTDSSAVMNEIERIKYDIILLDILMPKKNGMELLECIRSRYQNTKIIMMTGYADKDTAIMALKKGAFDFLEKPINLDLLSCAVRRALDVSKTEHQHQETLLELKHNQEILKARSERLEMLNKEIEEFNNALPMLVKTIDKVKRDVEKQIKSHVRSFVIPIVKDIEDNTYLLNHNQNLMRLLSYIENDAFDLADLPTITELSLQELRIAYMIKRDMSIQDIADHLYISPETVKTHRRNIRKKLGLRGTGKSLDVYLQTLTDNPKN